LQRGELASSHISVFIKPGSVADKLIVAHDIGTIAELVDSCLSRGTKNKIIRGLPMWVRPLLLEDYEYQSVGFNLVCNNSLVNLGKCSSRQMQDMLKISLRSVAEFQVCDKYEVEFNASLERSNWKHIWQIGHPSLLGTRLKILYKDVYSNERRHRFGLSDSPSCSVCGIVESVEHQLYECSNAKRLWKTLEKVTGYAPTDFYHLICYEGPLEVEVLKSVVFKLLVQINRSSNVNTTVFLNKVKWYINLEESCKNGKGSFESIKSSINCLLNESE